MSEFDAQKPQVEERDDPFAPACAEQTTSLVQDYLQLRHQVQELLSPYQSEVVVQLPPEGPYRIVHAGDLHFGHDSSDPAALSEAVKQTGDTGILVTHGNSIEGVSGKFLNTNTIKVGLSLDQQVQVARATLRPLDDDHRVIPVGGNQCHEGWAGKTATHDPLLDMFLPTTPRLFTGGQIIFKIGDKEVARVEAYHNAGSGRTRLSPEGSTRSQYRDIPIGHPETPDAIVDAHMHQLAAGQDVRHDPISDSDSVISLGQVGTAKGTKESPDGFLVGNGVPPRNQPADAGQGFVTIIREKSGTHSCYPVATYERANTMYEAEQLWENAQRTGAAEEIKGKILEFQKPSKPEFIVGESIGRDKDPAASAEGNAPFYKKLAYAIDTSLPISIQFIGNLRVGSRSLDKGQLTSLLRGIEDNTWSYYFATRRLLNQGTAMSSDRQARLKELAGLLGVAKKSLLGVMITDELRIDAWSKKRKNGSKEPIPPLKPGDFLNKQSTIKGVPLMTPETFIKMNVGNTPYIIYLRDKLSHFTSLINPFHGLTRVQQVWGINADVLVGGSTEIVGWRTWMRPWGQLEVVVPGGFAEYAEKGIGNRVNYPEGGQGFVLFPKKKMIFSAATAEDVHDLHEALWMREGLDQLGILTETMEKLEKKK